jgi:hypothetical protein
MNPELAMLAASCVLCLIQIILVLSAQRNEVRLAAGRLSLIFAVLCALIGTHANKPASGTF